MAEQNKKRANWSDAEIDDLVDIILSSEEWSKDLCLAAKPKSNAAIYNLVLVKFKERHSESTYTVDQLRTKFKNLQTEVNSYLKTIKTETGLQNVADEKGYGDWFNRLVEILKTKDSNQPGTVLEPGVPEVEAEPPRKKRKAADPVIDLIGEALKEGAEATKRSEKNIADFTKAMLGFMTPMAAAFGQMAQQMNNIPAQQVNQQQFIPQNPQAYPPMFNAQYLQQPPQYSHQYGTPPSHQLEQQYLSRSPSPATSVNSPQQFTTPSRGSSPANTKSFTQL